MVEEAFPGINARTTDDLAALSAKDVQHLPDDILIPILIQATLDRGGTAMNKVEIKRALESVHRGHWVPGLPRRGPAITQQDIDDLFAGGK